MTDKDHVFVGELKADSDVQGWLPKSFWIGLKAKNNDKDAIHTEF